MTISARCLNGAIIVKLSFFSQPLSAVIITPALERQARQRQNTVRILFWLVTIFFILNTLRAIKVAYSLTSVLLGKEHQPKPNWINIISPIYKLCLMLNSSLNFIIYCLAGENFRKQFAMLFETRKISLKKLPEIVFNRYFLSPEFSTTPQIKVMWGKEHFNPRISIGCNIRVRTSKKFGISV